MPTGGCKFSRDYAEGLQSGKYYDPTVGLVRFEAEDGSPIGVIFNFCCHPAVVVGPDCEYCTPDFVGSARQYIEEVIGGAPAMFVQGFCGDVRPRHMFTTCENAKRLGLRLGEAAVKGIGTLIPLRAEPFTFAWRTVDIHCQPMPSIPECEDQIARRQAFIDELQIDPLLAWCGGMNHPEPGRFSAEQRAGTARLTIDYYKEAIRMQKAGEEPRRTLAVTVGGVRIGDLAAALSPGENFTLTGLRVRERSPFAHTLICGDTNGLFGYMGTDEEIDRGGFETDFFWRILCFEGLRLPPAKGAADRILNTCVDLLTELHG